MSYLQIFFDSFESQTHSGESEQRNENFVISEGDAIEVREENIHKSFCTAVVSRFQQLDAVNDRNQRILDAFTRPLALLQFPTKQKNRIHPLAFKLKLKLLCKLLTLPILDQKVKFLLKCNGPGIMIAQYTESKHIPVMIPHQNEPSNVNQSGEIKSQLKPIWRFLPPLELELDLKGSVTVIGKSALVEVAEIKSSSAKSRKGKGQLKSRAFVMRWALQQLCLEISEVTLAGRVLINNSDVSVAEQNYVDASGMSIFVHPMWASTTGTRMFEGVHDGSRSKRRHWVSSHLPNLIFRGLFQDTSWITGDARAGSVKLKIKRLVIKFWLLRTSWWNKICILRQAICLAREE